MEICWFPSDVVLSLFNSMECSNQNNLPVLLILGKGKVTGMHLQSKGHHFTRRWVVEWKVGSVYSGSS